MPIDPAQRGNNLFRVVMDGAQVGPSYPSHAEALAVAEPLKAAHPANEVSVDSLGTRVIVQRAADQSLPAPTQGALRESADGAQTPPSPAIIDGAQAVWTLLKDDDPAAGGRSIARNGVVYPGRGVLLEYRNQRVYIKNSLGDWFVAVKGDWVKVAKAGDPPGAASAPAAKPPPAPSAPPAQAVEETPVPIKSELPNPPKARPSSLRLTRYYDTNVGAVPGVSCAFAKHTELVDIEDGKVAAIGGDGSWRLPMPDFPQYHLRPQQSLNAVLVYDLRRGCRLTIASPQFGYPDETSIPMYPDGCATARVGRKIYIIPGYHAKAGGPIHPDPRGNMKGGVVHAFDLDRQRYEEGAPVAGSAWPAEHWGGLGDEKRGRVWLQSGGAGHGLIQWYDCAAKTFHWVSLALNDALPGFTNIGKELITQRWDQCVNPATDEFLFFDGYRGLVLAVNLADVDKGLHPKPRIVAKVPALNYIEWVYKNGQKEAEPIETIEISMSISVKRQKLFISYHPAEPYVQGGVGGIWIVDLKTGDTEQCPYAEGEPSAWTTGTYSDSADALVLICGKGRFNNKIAVYQFPDAVRLGAAVAENRPDWAPPYGEVRAIAGPGTANPAATFANAMPRGKGDFSWSGAANPRHFIAAWNCGVNNPYGLGEFGDAFYGGCGGDGDWFGTHAVRKRRERSAIFYEQAVAPHDVEDVEVTRSTPADKVISTAPDLSEGEIRKRGGGTWPVVPAGHTYGHPQLLPPKWSGTKHGALLLPVSIYIYGGNYSSYVARKIDCGTPINTPAAMAYSRAANARLTIGDTGISCFDSVRGKCYTFDTGSSARHVNEVNRLMDFVNGVAQTAGRVSIKVSERGIRSPSMAFIPEHGIGVMMGRHPNLDKLHMQIYDMEALRQFVPRLRFVGNPPPLSAGNGLCYVPNRRCLYLMPAEPAPGEEKPQSIWRVQMPEHSIDPRIGEWAVSEYVMHGSKVIWTPRRGLWSSLEYNEKSDTIEWCNDIFGQTYAFTPPKT